MTIKVERVDEDHVLQSPKVVVVTGGPVDYKIRCLATDGVTKLSLFGADPGLGGIIIDDHLRTSLYRAGEQKTLEVDIPGRSSTRRALLKVTGS